MMGMGEKAKKKIKTNKKTKKKFCYATNSSSKMWRPTVFRSRRDQKQAGPSLMREGTKLLRQKKHRIGGDVGNICRQQR